MVSHGGSTQQHAARRGMQTATTSSVPVGGLQEGHTTARERAACIGKEASCSRSFGGKVRAIDGCARSSFSSGTRAC